jgi:hypothetical protein
MRLMPGELAYFYAGGGNRVEAAGGQAFEAGEEAVDGIVLLYVAAFELEVDEGAIERFVLGERGHRQGGIGGDDFPLFFGGGGEDVVGRRIGGQVDFRGAMNHVFVADQRVGDGGSFVGEGTVEEPLHRADGKGGVEAAQPNGVGIIVESYGNIIRSGHSSHRRCH